MTVIDAFGMTHVGNKRSNNEDQFLVASMAKSLNVRQTSLAKTDHFDRLATTEAWLLMVADGVGGLAGGELASGMAVETVGELIVQTADCYHQFSVREEHEFLEKLESAVEKTNDAVRNMFGGSSQGPATTLTLVMLMWPRAYFIHVGDTRFYYLHAGRLLQLTEDQTMGAMLVDEGVMTEEQAKRSSLDNVLSSAIGGEINPSIGLVDLDDDDRMLICSDGLIKHVEDDDIRTIMADAANAQEATQRLVDAALDGGGSDNITVVVAQRS